MACVAIASVTAAMSQDLHKVTSTIGLQRGMLLQQRVAPLLEEQQSASAEGKALDLSFAQETRTAAAEAAGLSLASVSVLGLQRSVTISKRPSPSESSPGVTSWPLAQAAVPAGAALPDAPLRLSDVSLLGLQRSAKIVRRQLQPKSDAGEQQQGAVMAGGTLFGLQRSMQLMPGAAPGAAPGVFLSKTTEPLLED